MSRSLNAIGAVANHNSRSKGFWRHFDSIGTHTPDNPALEEACIAQKICLAISELTEAMEARRNGKQADIQGFADAIPTFSGIEDTEVGRLRFQNAFKMYLKDSFGDELADAVIRISELASELQVDLDYHVEQKMKFNATREPMHGKKY